MHTLLILDLTVILLASLRLTRLVTTDTIGRKALRPVEDWFYDHLRQRDWWVVSLTTCAHCIGFWITGLVILSWWLASADSGPLTAWRLIAGTFALSYVVGHFSARLDAYDDEDDIMDSTRGEQ